MRLELLGTGGTHPSSERHTACVLLPELGLMLDAGTATFRVRSRPLSRERLDVVLTHGHLDHVVGLTYLFGLERDSKPVETVIHASDATLDAVRDHLLATALFPIQPFTRCEPLCGTLSVGDATITTFPLDHPGGSIGLRIDAHGESVAYVTDTRRVTESTLDAIRGVDLLLHEAHFDAANAELSVETGHCTSLDAAWAADQAGVGRLLMLHANPRAEPAVLARAVEEARSIRPEADYAIDEQVVVL
ncbi:MAG: MBL fold metallo-hydrolase [Planctomycetota bacterium]